MIIQSKHLFQHYLGKIAYSFSTWKLIAPVQNIKLYSSHFTWLFHTDLSLYMFFHSMLNRGHYSPDGSSLFIGSCFSIGQNLPFVASFFLLYVHFWCAHICSLEMIGVILLVISVNYTKTVLMEPLLMLGSARILYWHLWCCTTGRLGTSSIHVILLLLKHLLLELLCY